MDTRRRRQRNYTDNITADTSSISSINQAQALEEPNTVNVVDSDAEVIEEAATYLDEDEDDPVPGWEPQAGRPLWEQCLDDNVQRLLVMPRWPITSNEHTHYCARKAVTKLLHPREIPEDQRSCPVCYEPFEDCRTGVWEEKHLAVKLSCRGRHIIGSTCLLNWFEALNDESVYGCPLCRDKLVDPPSEKPDECFQDFIERVDELVLPVEQLRHHYLFQPWVPIRFFQLRREVRFLSYFLSDSLDLHVPPNMVATWRERAKLLLRILMQSLPNDRLAVRCLATYTIYEYESPAEIRLQTWGTRRVINLDLLRNVQRLTRLYVKEMDDSVNDFWTELNVNQTRTGQMDG